MLLNSSFDNNSKNLLSKESNNVKYFALSYNSYTKETFDLSVYGTTSVTTSRPPISLILE